MNQKQENSHPIKISEQMIYGSSRIGLNDKFSQLISWTQPPFDRASRTMGLKSYELTDHASTSLSTGLGNVLTVISDRKKRLAGATPAFEAVIETAQDYYPFGSLMPGRKYNAGEYRFGYQGSEKDDEITGVTGANITTFFRENDTRLGRWWSIDPKANAFESPYLSMGGNPIWYNDPLGDTIRLNGIRTLFSGKDDKRLTQFTDILKSLIGNKVNVSMRSPLGEYEYDVSFDISLKEGDKLTQKEQGVFDYLNKLNSAPDDFNIGLGGINSKGDPFFDMAKGAFFDVDVSGGGDKYDFAFNVGLLYNMPTKKGFSSSNMMLLGLIKQNISEYNKTSQPEIYSFSSAKYSNIQKPVYTTIIGLSDGKTVKF